jgi:hypothetical protein
MFSRFIKIKTATEDFLNGYKAKDPATFAAAQQAIGGVLILDGLIGIENPFQGKKRPGIFGSLGGVLFGLVFFFIPTFVNGISGLNKMTAVTTATVESVSRGSSGSDGSSSCSVTARYTVDGRVYEQQSSFSSSSMCGLATGSTIQINYNPDQPGSWGYDIKTLGKFLMIFQVAGLVVMLTFGATFVIRLLSIYFGWKLLQSGRALARTLPAGTDLNTIINEIKQNFTKHLFNSGGVGGNSILTSLTQTGPAVPAMQPVQTAQPVAQPAAVQPPAAGPLPVSGAPADPNNVQQP